MSLQVGVHAASLFQRLTEFGPLNSDRGRTDDDHLSVRYLFRTETEVTWSMRIPNTVIQTKRSKAKGNLRSPNLGAEERRPEGQLVVLVPSGSG